MKTYKILIPPILKTVTPGKEEFDEKTKKMIRRPPVTEVRHDTIDLSDEDAKPLLESRVIAVSTGETQLQPATASTPTPIAPSIVVEDPLEDEQSDLEDEEGTAILPPSTESTQSQVDLNNLTVEEALPLITQINDRAYLQALLAQETANKNRQTIKNAIQNRLD